MDRSRQPIGRSYKALAKKKLKVAKGRWPNEVPRVFWSYHTTPQSTTKEKSFKLVCDTDVMILIEISEPSLQVTKFSPQAQKKVFLPVDQIRLCASTSISRP